MGIYNYSSDYELFVAGDGYRINTLYSVLSTSWYKPRRSRSTDSKNKFSHSIIVLSRGCQIEKTSLETHKECFEALNAFMHENDIFLHISRGPNDDPSMFVKGSIPYERIILMEDYSLINIGEKGVLCIGGSVSLNRDWKLEKDGSFGAPRYYKNEKTEFKKEELDQITSSNSNIYCVISNMPPLSKISDFFMKWLNSQNMAPTASIGSYQTFLKNNNWIKQNNEVGKDVVKQMLVSDDIYNFLKGKGINLKKWCFTFSLLVDNCTDFYDVTKFVFMSKLKFNEVNFNEEEEYEEYGDLNSLEWSWEVSMPR